MNMFKLLNPTGQRTLNILFFEMPCLVNLPLEILFLFMGYVNQYVITVTNYLDKQLNYFVMKFQMFHFIVTKIHCRQRKTGRCQGQDITFKNIPPVNYFFNLGPTS
jgi:hypothetical protein